MHISTSRNMPHSDSVTKQFCSEIEEAEIMSRLETNLQSNDQNYDKFDNLPQRNVQKSPDFEKCNTYMISFNHLFYQSLTLIGGERWQLVYLFQFRLNILHDTIGDVQAVDCSFDLESGTQGSHLVACQVKDSLDQGVTNENTLV